MFGFTQEQTTGRQTFRALVTHSIRAPWGKELQNPQTATTSTKGSALSNQHSFQPGVSLFQTPLDFAEQPDIFQSTIIHLLTVRARMYETNVALGKTANWKYVI